MNNRKNGKSMCVFISKII